MTVSAIRYQRHREGDDRDRGRRVAEADPRMENVHFEDQLVDGRMRFDYRRRPGVVTRSNATSLMRAVGLDV